ELVGCVQAKDWPDAGSMGDAAPCRGVCGAGDSRREWSGWARPVRSILVASHGIRQRRLFQPGSEFCSLLARAAARCLSLTVVLGATPYAWGDHIRGSRAGGPGSAGTGSTLSLSSVSVGKRNQRARRGSF